MRTPRAIATSTIEIANDAGCFENPTDVVDRPPNLVTVCAVIAGGALYIEYVMSGFGPCKTVVRSSMPSPNGDKSLVIFGKECGTAVGFNTQASIAPASGSFSPEKNPAFFAISDEHVVTAKWLGADTVEIRGVIPGGAKVYNSEQSVGGITVVYR